MAEDETGEVLLRWHFPEYYPHQRPRGWWVAATAAWLALALWATLVEHSFLFLLILLFGAIIFVTLERRPPGEHECRITNEGIEVDDYLYLYEAITRFYIASHGELKNLYLDRPGLRRTMAIPLHGQDVEPVRRLLRERLTEDAQQNPPVLETVARWLRLH